MKAIIFITLLIALTATQSVEMNIVKCFEDGLTIVNDVKQFVDDYKSGKDVSSLISDIETAVQHIQAALPDCGAGSLTVETKVGDFASCVEDIKNLVDLAEKLKTDVSNKDISSLINDGMAFITLGKQTIADCGAGVDKSIFDGFNPFKCIQDGVKIVQDVTQFINDAQAGKDISSLIADIQTAVADIQTALPDCGAGSFANIETKVGDFASCVSDIKNLVDLAEKLKTDVSNKDISSLINDGMAFITLGKQTIADCGAGVNKSIFDGFNPFKCIQDGVKIVQDVTQFINDAQAGKDISSLIADIQTAVADIQTALPDCGAGSNFFEPEVEDFSSCLSDIKNLVDLAEKLKTDVTNKDISSLINDGVAFVNLGKQTIADCGAGVHAKVSSFNPVQCIEAGMKVVKDVKQFVNDAQSKKDISSLISDIQTVVQDIQAALPECGAKSIGFEFNVEDINSCMTDINNLVGVAQKIVTDVNNKDFISMIGDFTAFIQGAQQAITDCSSMTVAKKVKFNPLQCLKDASTMIKDVKLFINDAKAKKDIGSLIADIETVANDLKTAVADCGAGDIMYAEPEEIVNDLPTCLQDIESLVSLAQKIKTDVSNKDISSMINDAVAFVNGAKQALADCNFATPSKSIFNSNIIKCFQDADKLVKEVKQFIDDAKAKKSMSALLNDIEAVANLAKVAIPDCGFKMVEASTKVGDIASCLSDIESLVKLGTQLKTDIQNKDVSSMINDAIAFVNGAKQALADCKATATA